MANFYDAMTPKAELAIAAHSALDQFLYPYGEAELDKAKFMLLLLHHVSSSTYIVIESMVSILTKVTTTTSSRTTSTRSSRSAMTQLTLSTRSTDNSSPASTRPSCVSLPVKVRYPHGSTQVPTKPLSRDVGNLDKSPHVQFVHVFLTTRSRFRRLRRLLPERGNPLLVHSRAEGQRLRIPPPARVHHPLRRRVLRGALRLLGQADGVGERADVVLTYYNLTPCNGATNCI